MATELVAVRLKTISVAGTVAAFVAAATGVYIMLIASQGVGNHLGRIFFFVPGFIAMSVIACTAGAIVHGSIRRITLLALAAAGFGALGFLWLWINLLIPQPGFLLLLAAGLATVALGDALLKTRSWLGASLASAMGVCVALLILGVGLSISVAPACGSAGSSFHIDKWSRPAATVYVCSDGRLSFEFIQG